ncbi:MAG: hypothetical protein OEZ02_11445, partial [Anaerolineae bacterium]|nr:hypothetical protein [Anaerolineae bacterium]
RTGDWAVIGMDWQAGRSEAPSPAAARRPLPAGARFGLAGGGFWGVLVETEFLKETRFLKG